MLLKKIPRLKSINTSSETKSVLSQREDARAAVSDQQVRAETPRYPVDRYLVESSKKFELVNIIDDEIWNPEPALRPEDEIILRKLHEMLQSTADDLKLLSGELSKFHEPVVQVKMQPTPLDEEFNEKIHIEEVVNARFHGHKIVGNSITQSPVNKVNDTDFRKSVKNNLQKAKINTGVQGNSVSIKKQCSLNRNLAITRPKVIQIGENGEVTKNMKLNNGKVINNMPAVAYNEFYFKYVEPKIKVNPQRNLQIQDMPSINIRSELKEQKVLQIDIIPEAKDNFKNTTSKPNISVIAMEHQTEAVTRVSKDIQPSTRNIVHYPKLYTINKQPLRKISTMSACDSSGSTNNNSSDTQHVINTQKLIKSVIRTSPKSSVRIDRGTKKKDSINKKESHKRYHLNLDAWKKKLNTVYGHASNPKSNNTTSKNIKKESLRKSNLPSSSRSNNPKTSILNNADYIPYSKLTLGGVPVSDVEREISDIPHKNDIPLSPILDKILNSRENSFQNDSPRRIKKRDSPKILTTSDENLLQEVLDIENTVSGTISKNLKKNKNAMTKQPTDKTNKVPNSDGSDHDSYADDFEDDKSDNTQNSVNKPNSDAPYEANISSKFTSDDNESINNEININDSQTNVHNRTYTKALNLSFKNSVDVYEFVHSVDTQDSATQSNITHKISLKETQTSPRNDRSTIQPHIHNDLWPSIDPRGEVEKMFKLEKDFIKKLIIEEYGDLLEKNIAKPSTSSEVGHDRDINVHAFQKNTQTSPAHVKSVMTSPTRTKTRTTSPFLSLTVDHQTSPMVVITNEEQFKVEVDDDEGGISINLSSPRFSLRLPQTSRDVLTNLEVCSHTSSNVEKDRDRSIDKPNQNTSNKKNAQSSSTSLDGHNSSSEISSLGEVKLKLKRRLTKNRVLTVSESSSSSLVSRSSMEAQIGGILPLRSEGEVSVGQIRKTKASRSDGETSFGQLIK